jgi:hypothetical protein
MKTLRILLLATSLTTLIAGHGVAQAVPSAQSLQGGYVYQRTEGLRGCQVVAHPDGTLTLFNDQEGHPIATARPVPGNPFKFTIDPGPWGKDCGSLTILENARTFQLLFANGDSWLKSRNVQAIPSAQSLQGGYAYQRTEGLRGCQVVAHPDGTLTLFNDQEGHPIATARPVPGNPFKFTIDPGPWGKDCGSLTILEDEKTIELLFANGDSWLKSRRIASPDRSGANHAEISEHTLSTSSLRPVVLRSDGTIKAPGNSGTRHGASPPSPAFSRVHLEGGAEDPERSDRTRPTHAEDMRPDWQAELAQKSQSPERPRPGSSAPLERSRSTHPNFGTSSLLVPSSGSHNLPSLGLSQQGSSPFRGPADVARDGASSLAKVLADVAEDPRVMAQAKLATRLPSVALKPNPWNVLRFGQAVSNYVKVEKDVLRQALARASNCPESVAAHAAANRVGGPTSASINSGHSVTAHCADAISAAAAGRHGVGGVSSSLSAHDGPACADAVAAAADASRNGGGRGDQSGHSGAGSSDHGHSGHSDGGHSGHSGGGGHHDHGGRDF